MKKINAAKIHFLIWSIKIIKYFLQKVFLQLTVDFLLFGRLGAANHRLPAGLTACATLPNRLSPPSPAPLTGCAFANAPGSTYHFFRESPDQPISFHSRTQRPPNRPDQLPPFLLATLKNRKQHVITNPTL